MRENRWLLKHSGIKNFHKKITQLIQISITPTWLNIYLYAVEPVQMSMTSNGYVCPNVWFCISKQPCYSICKLVRSLLTMLSRCEITVLMIWKLFHPAKEKARMRRKRIFHASYGRILNSLQSQTVLCQTLLSPLMLALAHSLSYFICSPLF